jgi:phosphocarrier protein
MHASSETTLTCRVRVMATRGLHLRLASDICRTCAAHAGVQVAVARPQGGAPVDARSPLSLITLAAIHGEELLLSCTGALAEAQALQKDLQNLFAKEA